MMKSSCRMARIKRKKPGHEQAIFSQSGEACSARVKEFVRRAPQFTSLVETAEGRRRELSPSQRAFLDDFATKLAEGATERGDTL